MSNSTQRTKLRKQLLDNGYRPLPLLDKGIRIKGWSTATIDADWLKQFERNGKYQNTGIRCDDLIAFDIDVYDEDLANEIEELIESYWGQTDLCRIGQWPKRLLLYRLSGEAIRSVRTGKFGGHQVELLTGSGRQFAAFGTHPTTGKPYTWEHSTPHDTPFEDLPLIEGIAAQSALEQIEQLFLDKGLERESPGNTIGSSGVKLYDLADDTPFMLDGAETTWSALKDVLTETGLWVNAMRENGEYGDSDGVHCFISKGSQQPCAHDFPRDVTHFDEIISADARKLFPDPPDDPVQIVPPDKSVLDDMIEKWVVLADETARMVDKPLTPYKIGALKILYKQYRLPAPTPNNANATRAVMDMWLEHPDTKRAFYAEMRPDKPGETLLVDKNIEVLNSYRAPVHPDGGEVETALRFIEHLVPDPIERELFIEWHATKVANPSFRQHGLIMVTPTHGTGRNTWLGIVRKMFGPDYVKDTPFQQLVGLGSQGAYNDYLADSLIVAVTEALDDSDQGQQWRIRQHAYERLKHVCDTSPTRMHIKRKYGKNSMEQVYASIIIASNHPDLLAIEPGDRRLVVIENTLQALDGALADAIHLWEQDPANIGALHRWFLQRYEQGTTYDPYRMPMNTAAKERMVSLSRSDLDLVWSAFAETAPGALCSESQWRAWALRLSLEMDLSLPTGDLLHKGLRSVLCKHSEKIYALKDATVKIDGKSERPWIIRDKVYWRSCEDKEEIRHEFTKNIIDVNLVKLPLPDPKKKPRE